MRRSPYAAAVLSSIHDNFAWFVVAANAVVGFWALGADRYPALRGRWLWRAIAVAQVSIFVQAALGAGIISQGIQVEQFHMFYGFLCIVGVAILYGYRNNDQLARYRYLLYGFGSLFIMGLALRAVYVDL
jgi:hypothetical protein